MLLCMVLVASYLPVSILTAVAEPTTMTGTDRVTDPSTLEQILEADRLAREFVRQNS